MPPKYFLGFLSFLCSFRAAKGCADPTSVVDCWNHCKKVVIGDTCYAQLSGYSAGAPTASGRCTTAGGSMAAFHREEDWRAILAAGLSPLTCHWPASPNPLLLPGFDEGFIDLFQSSDATSPAEGWQWWFHPNRFARLDYVLWSDNAGAPNGAGGYVEDGTNQHAVLLPAYPGGAVDASNSISLNPICMYNYSMPTDSTVSPMQPPAVDRRNGSCVGSPGSVTLRGHLCYFRMAPLGSACFWNGAENVELGPPVTYSEAATACEAEGGFLAIFETAADLAGLPPWWTGWVGLVQDDGAAEPSGGFHWQLPDGNSVPNSLEGVWEAGSPDNADPGESHVTRASQGGLKDHRPDIRARPICQWTVPPPARTPTAPGARITARMGTDKGMNPVTRATHLLESLTTPASEACLIRCAKNGLCSSVRVSRRSRLGVIDSSLLKAEWSEVTQQCQLTTAPEERLALENRPGAVVFALQ